MSGSRRRLKRIVCQLALRNASRNQENYQGLQPNLLSGEMQGTLAEMFKRQRPTLPLVLLRHAVRI